MNEFLALKIGRTFLTRGHFIWQHKNANVGVEFMLMIPYLKILDYDNTGANIKQTSTVTSVKVKRTF